MLKNRLIVALIAAAFAVPAAAQLPLPSVQGAASSDKAPKKAKAKGKAKAKATKKAAQK